MRIGVDARLLYAPLLKGIGHYLQQLLLALAAVEKKNEYILFYDGRQDVVKRLPCDGRFSEIELSVSKGDTYFLWEQWRLPVELRKRPVDLFHSSANTTYLWKTCPNVVTVHDTKLLEMKSGNYKSDFYNMKFQPFALRGATQVICVSNFTKQRLVECVEVPESKVVVTHPGISGRFCVIEDKDRIGKVRAKYGIQEQYVFSAGGESGPKNISNLIAAFAISKKSTRIAAQLVICGIRSKDILQKHQTEIAERGLLGQVLVLGYLLDEELIALYNGAQLFVYPSLWEGFGFPPLEAMACGTAVAASSATSIPEVVGDAALLFDGTDIEEMAARISMLLSDPALRHDLRLKGFERVKQFSWEDTARRTLEVYERAANLRRS